MLKLESCIVKLMIMNKKKSASKKLGKKKINFRLKDWGISRQRYWGCPIPIAYDNENNIVKIPEKMLPIELPENIDLNLKGNPLDHQKKWTEIKINNKWTLFEYEYKRNELFYEFDNYFLNQTKNLIEVFIEDMVGNKTQKSFTFYRN